MNSSFTQRRWAVTGALLAAASVVLGAFATHSLKEMLTPDRLETFRTGISYMQYHALGILVCSQWMTEADSTRAAWAARLFVAGIVLFTGSLATLSITGMTWLGAVAPIGGLAFITGWVMLAIAVSRPRLPRTGA